MRQTDFHARALLFQAWPLVVEARKTGGATCELSKMRNDRQPFGSKSHTVKIAANKIKPPQFLPLGSSVRTRKSTLLSKTAKPMKMIETVDTSGATAGH